MARAALGSLLLLLQACGGSSSGVDSDAGTNGTDAMNVDPDQPLDLSLYGMERIDGIRYFADDEVYLWGEQFDTSENLVTVLTKVNVGGAVQGDFAEDGALEIPPLSGGQLQIAQIEKDPSGNLLVSYRHRPDGGEYAGPAVSRISAEGILDTSYADAGYFWIPGIQAQAGGFAIQRQHPILPGSDGSVVLGYYGDKGGDFGAAMRFARVNAQGELDTSYGNESGFSAFSEENYTYPVELHRQSDGVLILAGNGSGYGLLYKMDEAGASVGFGGQGSVPAHGSSTNENRSMGMQVQPDGDIIVAMAEETRDLNVHRLLADGTLVDGGVGPMNAFFDQRFDFHTFYERDDGVTILACSFAAATVSSQVEKLSLFEFGDDGVLGEETLIELDESERIIDADAVGGRGVVYVSLIERASGDDEYYFRRLE